MRHDQDVGIRSVSGGFRILQNTPRLCRIASLSHIVTCGVTCDMGHGGYFAFAILYYTLSDFLPKSIRVNNRLDVGDNQCQLSKVEYFEHSSGGCS